MTQNSGSGRLFSENCEFEFTNYLPIPLLLVFKGECKKLPGSKFRDNYGVY